MILQRIQKSKPQEIKILRQSIMKSINRNHRVLSSMKMIKLLNNKEIQMLKINNLKLKDNLKHKGNLKFKDNQKNNNKKYNIKLKLIL